MSQISKQYEAVNEPIVEKLERAAKSCDSGRIQAAYGPHFFHFDGESTARSLRDNADRIRKSHTEKVTR
jgi:hypothetical protein